MSERRWAQVERDSIVLGVIKLGGGGGNMGKIDQIVKFFFFLANLQNEIKSFDAAIDHPIAEVPPEGFGPNHKIRAAGPSERLHHGCVLF